MCLSGKEPIGSICKGEAKFGWWLDEPSVSSKWTNHIFYSQFSQVATARVLLFGARGNISRMSLPCGNSEFWFLPKMVESKRKHVDSREKPSVLIFLIYSLKCENAIHFCKTAATAPSKLISLALARLAVTFCVPSASSSGAFEGS